MKKDKFKTLFSVIISYGMPQGSIKKTFRTLFSTFMKSWLCSQQHNNGKKDSSESVLFYSGQKKVSSRIQKITKFVSAHLCCLSWQKL